VLSLEKKYGRSKLIDACTIAIEANIIGYNYIQRICSNPYSMPRPVMVNAGLLPMHENVRGNYY
jgi:hypothetical protein